MVRSYGYRRPNSYATHILQMYSSRGWIYHSEQGWVFDELTPEELAILKADYAPIIPTIRFPKGTVVIFHQPTLDYENWFAYCILTDLHALAFSLFQLCKLRYDDTKRWSENYFPLRLAENATNEMIEYPLDVGVYGGWLWKDEITVCEALGCEVEVQYGIGWEQWIPPTKQPPLPLYQNKTFIYALVDPKTQEVRYVGKADDPQKRFASHLNDTSNPYKAFWIRQLKAQGYIPTLKILEEVEGAMGFVKESQWIKYYWEKGHNLTNSNSQLYMSNKKDEILNTRNNKIYQMSFANFM